MQQNRSSRTEIRPVHRRPGEITHMTAPALSSQQLCGHYPDSSMLETPQQRRLVHAQFSDAACSTQLLVHSRQATCMHCQYCSMPGPRGHDWQAGVTVAEYACNKHHMPLVCHHSASDSTAMPNSTVGALEHATYHWSSHWAIQNICHKQYIMQTADTIHQKFNYIT